METQTFITSRKKFDRTFLTQWRVTSQPAELTEAQKATRWYQVIGQSILAVTKVSVQSELHLEGHALKTEADWEDHAKRIFPETYTVIHTAHGTACIVQFEVATIQGITMNGGGRSKPKAFTLGTWRKYGSKRGHGMAYLRAMAGMGRCTSPESGRDICEFEAWVRLTTGGYSEAAAKAFNQTQKAA